MASAPSGRHGGWRSGVLDVHRGLAAAALPADEVVVDPQAAVRDVGLAFARDARVLVARELVVLALPEQDVVALVAEQEIAARAAVDDVGPGAAVEGVAVLLTVDPVVAGTRLDVVVRIPAA